MPYIMNVVRKQEKGSLDISFDLICNPYNISFLIPSQQAVFASSHLLDVFIHFFLMGIMSWLSLRDILNDFFISQKDFFCVCVCMCNLLEDERQMSSGMKRKGISEWVVTYFVVLSIQRKFVVWIIEEIVDDLKMWGFSWFV